MKDENAKNKVDTIVVFIEVVGHQAKVLSLLLLHMVTIFSYSKQYCIIYL
jgi:hypothetical protein